MTKSRIEYTWALFTLFQITGHTISADPSLNVKVLEYSSACTHTAVYYILILVYYSSILRGNILSRRRVLLLWKVLQSIRVDTNLDTGTRYLRRWYSTGIRNTRISWRLPCKLDKPPTLIVSRHRVPRTDLPCSCTPRKLKIPKFLRYPIRPPRPAEAVLYATRPAFDLCKYGLRLPY